MRLTGIDCQIPSNKIRNEDVLELIKFYSASHFNGSIKDLESMIRRFLSLTGINSRFWRNKKEKPIELISTAVDRALKMAGIKKSEIDLVLYSSIDRGYIEPANASFICKNLGLDNTRSFDIVDACMGWCSAFQTAQSFLISDPSISSVLIINAEFPMDDLGSVLPNNFTIYDTKELQWKSPSFTLGEGASACVFQKDDSATCQFEFIESPQYANLCTIPIMNFEKYDSDSKGGDPSLNLQFYANGTELLKSGMGLSIEVLNTLLKKLDYNPKIIFPHSVSDKIIQDGALKANVTPLIYSTFPELGNVATVSIPSSITKAFLNNVIKKGEKGVGWIASAGMKFSAFEIQF